MARICSTLARLSRKLQWWDTSGVSSVHGYPNLAIYHVYDEQCSTDKAYTVSLMHVNSRTYSPEDCCAVQGCINL